MSRDAEHRPATPPPPPGPPPPGIGLPETNVPEWWFFVDMGVICVLFAAIILIKVWTS